eukprot:CAMPEP_0118946260 /NCGR_PEP_ID=MMETSP1169-20130426/43899_1 /TAXON_ID=36882 /ORGANISM="Pyramimonas obovata, Strain CCMP722" /LENGTH=181 /DNA_ID=CAMNT_0006892187 /DNA_START=33 /DNA_END=575 /DNA_ORIENTATION=+
MTARITEQAEDMFKKRMTCFLCGQEGHISEQCRTRMDEYGRALAEEPEDDLRSSPKPWRNIVKSTMATLKQTFHIVPPSPAIALDSPKVSPNYPPTKKSPLGGGEARSPTLDKRRSLQDRLRATASTLVGSFTGLLFSSRNPVAPVVPAAAFPTIAPPVEEEILPDPCGVSHTPTPARGLS